MSKINLLPWRDEVKKIKTRIFVSGLIVTVLISAVVVYFVAIYYDIQIAKQNANIAYINKELSAIRAQINEFKDLQETKDQILNRMNIIQELRSDRVSIVKLFDVIPRVVPDNIYLKKLSRILAKDAPPPPTATNETSARGSQKAPSDTKVETDTVQENVQKRRYHIYMEGVAEANESISTLLKNLEKINFLSHVYLTEVAINNEGKGLNFKISMTQYLNEKGGQ